MVERIKEAAVQQWPMLLLVLAMSGGGNAVANVVSFWLTGASPSQEQSATQISQLAEEVSELAFAVRGLWTVPMEVTAWDKAGREIRKTIPDWQGPDAIEIRRIHSDLTTATGGHH